MQISQIYFTDNNSSLPRPLEICTNTVKNASTQFDHVLYDLQSGRDFIVDNFNKEVVMAFDKLRPYAYKADLLRYCLLHKIGGWYFDIGVKCISNIDDIREGIETIAFNDLPIFSRISWSCQNSVLYSTPNSPVYEKAIELVLENCKNEHYGTNAICPTGPGVLGRAFAIIGESDNRIFGDVVRLTPMHMNKNLAFVLVDGRILALGKPTKGGDLTAFGTTGTNNYNYFYDNKMVYKK